jgi:hypothetical protein
MQGDYPRFNTTYTHEELVEHFLLTPADRTLVNTCRGEANRHGVAVLLKSVQYLGYFPDSLGQVPEAGCTHDSYSCPAQHEYDHVLYRVMLSCHL